MSQIHARDQELIDVYDKLIRLQTKWLDERLEGLDDDESISAPVLKEIREFLKANGVTVEFVKGETKERPTVRRPMPFGAQRVS